MDIKKAKSKLDSVIAKSRNQFYKPIQVAEVLYRSRVHGDINVIDKETYRNLSKKWRDEVSKQLIGKVSSSSSKFQDDLWNDHAIPPYILEILDRENKQGHYPGVVEYYIYENFIQMQGVITAIIEKIKLLDPKIFKLQDLLTMFKVENSIKRNIDKCYEIITYSLFETIVTSLDATITVKVSPKKLELLDDFRDLTKALLNLDLDQTEWTEFAHIYRVGVTNAADRGLDMWANFGPAIQVKHINLQQSNAENIVDQIESDHIVIVCRDCEAPIIKNIMSQIGWGQRVRGIITEQQLIGGYEKCLRGKFSQDLSPLLIKLLNQSFEYEFPQAVDQASKIKAFCQSRGYDKIKLPEMWQTRT